jgi:hypothetical protein
MLSVNSLPGPRGTLVAGCLVATFLSVPSGAGWASTVFTSGSFTLPEAIVPAPGGGYLVSDADNDNISIVPATGGASTSSQAEGFRVFGEVQLPSNYGANSGTFLAYGTNAASNNGVTALVGTSGIAAPASVTTAPGWYDGAAVSPTAYGAIAAGSVVLSNNLRGNAGSIVVLNPNLSSTTTFATLNFDPIDVGFAPSSFGTHAGQMFVADSSTGNLYTVSSSGQATLFATLPLPTGFFQPGLRQFAWAPSAFGSYGGDLFVSIAAQNGGGGTTGEIDVLNALGQTVALYYQGNGSAPLDPRGLDFVDANTLLVANADPGIVQTSPADFLPASEVLPEPGSMPTLLVGLGAIPALTWVRHRRMAVAGGPATTR